MSSSLRPGKRPVLIAGVIAFAVSLILVTQNLDGDALARTWRNALADPSGLLLAAAAYLSAFILRSAIWTRVLPGLTRPHALAAIHVSLAGNHLLPFRLGEALRITTVTRRAGVSIGAATASTVMLRAADILSIVVLAVALGPRFVFDSLGLWVWAIALPAAGVWVAGVLWLRKLTASRGIAVRSSTIVVAVGAGAAWVLEAVVMWEAARWAGIELSALDAVLVTAVTIASQIVAIAPGGFGTYEAVAAGAMVAGGADPGAALAAALAAHAFKTAYSLIGGGIALFVPSPGAFGRLRLPKPPSPGRGDASPGDAPADAPIVLFLPAHNEEAVVADVIRRAPVTVLGHPVKVIVVDDGSTDRTAERSAMAGATVVQMGTNRGLGAAVRRGLSEALALGPAAVAFCDADGEYAPEELEDLVAPIVRGEADYVIGSRFAGRIDRMLPHRRFGNIVLTRMMRFISRAPITDGQSGYRAFSPEAARRAEIIHDFNYAQVLTLDLLHKGFRYQEVPIGYAFREHGRSFVKLGRYLRHVIPAIHREINDRATA
jgi:uncharacterized membrane protein YbhN (UPF0104 family)